VKEIWKYFAITFAIVLVDETCNFVYEQGLEKNMPYLVQNFKWFNVDDNVNKQQKMCKRPIKLGVTRFM
jgi:hypothetical protein